MTAHVGSNPTLSAIGVWCSGNTSVSRTEAVGSIPTTPAIHDRVAEWLGDGLQSRIYGFDSRLGLQRVHSQGAWHLPFKQGIWSSILHAPTNLRARS